MFACGTCPVFDGCVERGLVLWTVDLQVVMTQVFSMTQNIYFKFKQKVAIGSNQ